MVLVPTPSTDASRSFLIDGGEDTWGAWKED